MKARWIILGVAGPIVIASWIALGIGYFYRPSMPIWIGLATGRL